MQRDVNVQLGKQQHHAGTWPKQSKRLSCAQASPALADLCQWQLWLLGLGQNLCCTSTVPASTRLQDGCSKCCHTRGKWMLHTDAETWLVPRWPSSTKPCRKNCCSSSKCVRQGQRRPLCLCRSALFHFAVCIQGCMCILKHTV